MIRNKKKINNFINSLQISGFGGNSSHTFHVHGYHVSVVGIDSLKKPITKGEISALDADKALPRNLDNPPKKDTFTVPNKGYAILRFRSDNLGTYKEKAVHIFWK
jgi:FtsP/CotA-like multicopper oxidase with cupredoxin domain